MNECGRVRAESLWSANGRNFTSHMHDHERADDAKIACGIDTHVGSKEGQHIFGVGSSFSSSMSSCVVFEGKPKSASYHNSVLSPFLFVYLCKI